MINSETPQHGFLFGNENGPWTTERLTKTMVRETMTRVGFHMTTQEYRDIVIAIDHKFIHGEDVEPDEDEEEDDVYDLMAVHSTKLALA